PGALLFGIGIVPLCILAFGPLTIGTVTFSINSMLLCLAAGILGLQLFTIGAVAQSLYDPIGQKRCRWLAIFSYTRTTLLTALAFLGGSTLVIRFVAGFIANNYVMSDSLIE